MKRFALLIFALAAAPALAQNDAVNGFCTQGATKALTSGLQSSNMQQGIIPKCTVTVYFTGTTNLAPIFSNAGGTTLLNPFTAAVSGQWLFYGAIGLHVDVVTSSGTSLTDVVIGGGGGGGASFPATPAVVVNTSTSASRNAVFGDIVGLFGGGTCTGFLKNDGTCAVTSGTPGGLQTQIQGNGGGGVFIGTKTTTDNATGLQLNTPILNGNFDASKFQSSPGANDGIVLAEAAAGVNGVTVASPNYPFVEATGYPNSSGTLFDYRMGGARHLSTNPFIGTGLNTVSVNSNDCYFDYNANPTATDMSFCQDDINIIAGIGNDAGGGVTPTGGNIKTTTMVRNGITAVDENAINCWKDGDCHAARFTFSTQGLNSDLSLEGFGAFMPHFLQTPYLFVSTITSVTDSTHVKANAANVGGAYGTQMGGGWLVKQANIDAGNIIADNNPSGGIVNRRFTTSNTHAVSTAGGATTTILTPTADFVFGTPTPVTVTKKWGTWPASGQVCISGDHTYQTTFSGATDGATVTMTIASRYEEPIGSTIVVGPCRQMFSVPDRQSNFINPGITSEISVDIIGAPDATTYLYTLTGVATRDGNALNGSYNWRTDLSLGLAAGATAERDASNNISFADNNGNSGFGYWFMGPRTITVSGCTPSNFNFGPTAITIATNGNPNLLQYVQPGAILGAASATGCIITQTGFNGFTLHEAARVVSASDPTIPKSGFPFTGYYQLATNTAGFAPGDAVEQPTGNTILVDQISEVTGQTPTLGGRPSHPIIDWTCKGYAGGTGAQCSGGMTPISIANQAGYNIYKGGGGLYDLMTMANVSGPWGNYWNYGNAPANGGFVTFLGCPPEGCASPTPYKVFSFTGTASADLTYTPLTGLLAYGRNFFATKVSANDMNSFTWSNNQGLKLEFANGATNFNCITFIANCGFTGLDDTAILGDNTSVDKSLYLRFLHGGNIRFQTFDSGFAYKEPCTLSATLLDCSVGGGPGGIGTGAAAKFTGLTIPGTADGCATFATGVLGSTGATCGTGGGGGVASINGTVGAFTFTGSGVSCTTTTCTFSGGGGGGVTSFNTRTGAVTATSGDYNFGLISGNLGTGQGPTSLTGILKDAAGTLTAAVAADFPTLNQNTTGSAAKWTTARLLAGNSVDGSANVAFANKVILQGTTDTGFTNAQFLGALATGLVKNTITTGVLSIAVSADVIGLWTGTCSSSTFLRGDGACAAPSGSGNTTSTSLTTNTIPKANGANSIINSGLTDDGTKLTYTGSGTANGWQIPEGTPIAGLAANGNLWPDSTTHRWMQNPNALGAFVVPGVATAGTAGHLWVVGASGYDLVDGGVVPGGSTGSITGSGLTTGSVYYFNGATLTVAKADVSTTLPGVCVASSSTVCVYSGAITTGSWTAGGLLYVSDSSAGALTQTAPTTSGHFIQVVGIATSTTAILVMPSLNVGGIQ